MMKFISRRAFLTVLLATGVTGLATGCGAGSCTIIGTPTSDAESIHLAGNAAQQYAEEHQNVPYADVTEILQQLRLEYAAAAQPVPFSFYEELFTTWFYGLTFGSVRTLVQQEQNCFDLSSTQPIVLTAQQAADQAAALLFRQQPERSLVGTTLYCYRAAAGTDDTERPYWAVFQFIEDPAEPGITAFGSLLRLDAVTGQLRYYSCAAPRLAAADQLTVHHKGDAAYAEPIIRQFFTDAGLPFVPVSLQEDPAMLQSLNGRWLAELDNGRTARVEIDLHEGYRNYVIDYSLLMQ